MGWRRCCGRAGGYVPGDADDPTIWFEALDDTRYNPTPAYGLTRWQEFTTTSSYWDDDSIDVFKGWPDFGPRESVQGALRYIDGNHHLYFRGATHLFTDTMFDFNLTTGSYSMTDTIVIPAGSKPKLMGVPLSSADPYDFDKIIMMTQTKVYTVSLDTPTVLDSSIHIDDVVQSKRPGFSSYVNTFVAPRINGRLKGPG